MRTLFDLSAVLDRRRDHWVLALMLLVLHTALNADLESQVARALMTAPNKYDWTAKSEAFWPVAFEPYPDANAGFAARTWRDGPGHRSHGPVTVSATPTVGAVTATTAVVNWASAAGGTAPYTYQVYTGGVLSNINNVSGTSGTVSGLTTNTVYNFTVRAKDSAFHQSGASTAVSGKTA